MITIKCNPYSEREIQKLRNLLSIAAEKLCEAADESTDCQGVYGLSSCEDCPYKHVCYDLNHAEAYLDGLLDRRGL